MTDIWKDDVFDNLVRLKRGYDLPNRDIVNGLIPVVAIVKERIKWYTKTYGIFKRLPTNDS